MATTAVSQVAHGTLSLHSGSLIEDWLCSSDLAENSRSAYFRNFRNFQRWCASHGIQNPDRNAILAYKKYLVEQKYTACFQSNVLTSVRLFFRYLEQTHGHPNPMRNIKGIRHPSGHRKDALSLEQLRTLLSSIPTNSLRGLRDLAILNLAARTGLRGCEISRADVGDLLQRGGKHILVVQGKARLEKDNYVILGPDCYGHLQRYLAQRGTARASDPLFASVSDGCRGARLGTASLRKMAKRYFRAIGISTPRISLHSLRHTAISLSLQAGATLLEAKEMARHDQVASTMIYAHSAHRLETAAELKLESLLRTTENPITETAETA